jgi:CRISPR-associated exonuclease Cas4
MEHTSELVEIGKHIHETTFTRENKEIQIGPIKIDFIDNDGVIHEIKKSPKMEKAHVWQLKYYIYYLKKNGIDNITGVLHYPTLKQKETIYLDDNDVVAIENLLDDILCVTRGDIPGTINKSRCNMCSYYELCYIS